MGVVHFLRLQKYEMQKARRLRLPGGLVWVEGEYRVQQFWTANAINGEYPSTECVLVDRIQAVFEGQA